MMGNPSIKHLEDGTTALVFSSLTEQSSFLGDILSELSDEQAEEIWSGEIWTDTKKPDSRKSTESWLLFESYVFDELIKPLL